MAPCWRAAGALGLLAARVHPILHVRLANWLNSMVTTTEDLWETLHDRLLRFIRARVSDETSAEDILQDVFLKIHARIDTLRDQDRLQSWIWQIVRNALSDHYRALRPMVEALPDPYREALQLTEYQGLTQQELAQRAGISLSGAKSRVQRAREKLKALLLDCCHFELDRRGGIIDYHSHCPCCVARGSSPACRTGCCQVT